MDYNQAIQVLRNAIDCIECEDCVRECCTTCDLVMEKEDVIDALNFAMDCI